MSFMLQYNLQQTCGICFVYRNYIASDVLLHNSQIYC
jgi:hypothetical protein